MDAASARRVLGVDATAPPEAVRRAYLKAALRSHPDKGGSAEAFQRVQDAFEAARRAPAPTPSEAPEQRRRHRPPPPPPRRTSAGRVSVDYEGHGQQARGRGYAAVYRCASCGEAFPSRRRLRHHFRTEHDPGGAVADAAASRAAAAGRPCEACGWRNCQCAKKRAGGEFDFERLEREEAARLRRSRERPAAQPATPTEAEAEAEAEDEAEPSKRAWFERARESLAERNAARFEARSASEAFVGVGGGGARSSRRVFEEQVSILRDMGFARDKAQRYADPDVPLDTILELMCFDGVEFDEPRRGPWSRLAALFLPSSSSEAPPRRRRTWSARDDALPGI